MIIDGKERGFAYTVGAYISVQELQLKAPKTLAQRCKMVIQMAAIMNRAYEEKKKLEDPLYKMEPVTMMQLNALSIQEVAEQLSPEVDAAVKEGLNRTVEAEPVKN